MKKLIILLTLVTLSFSADKWEMGDPTPDGWIFYPTFDFSVTNGKLSYYYEGELMDPVDDPSGGGWSEDAKGKFGTQIKFSGLLPISKNVSLFSNYTKMGKHLTIYHGDYGQTRQSDSGGGDADHEESWYTITLGMKYRFTP
mgnify:CR=1 FL=1